MSNYPTEGSLELEVTNFGPITRGKIDLRPLTIFVGPSNTGKSYLAILIYALHRHFSSSERSHHRARYLSPPLIESNEKTFSESDIADFLNWAEQAFGRVKNDNKSVILPASVTKLIGAIFDAHGDPFRIELSRCFGSDISKLIRKGSTSDARIVVRQQLARVSDHFEYGLTISPQEIHLKSAVPEELEMQMDRREISYEFNHLIGYFLREKSELDADEAEFFFRQALGTLAALAQSHLVGALNLPAFYLPADRTGVMHSHSVVVSALIESAAMTGLRPAARTPMLSGVLADFLEQLIELGAHPRRHWKRRRRGNYADKHAARIEKAILAGSVRMKRAKVSGYPHFTYRPKGWKDDLPLMNASSMVSELAPVILYLRYRVQPGNMLIVEEPESHLHPAMQVEFIRQLAALIRSGIRVIVTTHSEWVLEELANIVRRSRLSEEQRKEFSGSDIALSPDHVGAWLFKPKRRPKGSVVEEIRLDESGLYPSEFDDVAADLHNKWAAISSLIGDHE